MCLTELERRVDGNEEARENISMDQVIFVRHRSIGSTYGFFARKEDELRVL